MESHELCSSCLCKYLCFENRFSLPFPVRLNSHLFFVYVFKLSNIDFLVMGVEPTRIFPHKVSPVSVFLERQCHLGSRGPGCLKSRLWGYLWASCLALRTGAIKAGASLTKSIIITIPGNSMSLDCFLLQSSMQMVGWAFARGGILMVTLG